MSIEIYFLYLGTLAVFFAAPPDSTEFLVMANASRLGLKKSLWTVAGDLSANSVQMTIAAFGLSTLIGLSANFFLVVKWLGVAYLVWLGFSLIRSGQSQNKVDVGIAQSNGMLFRQGFITSMTNPYAIIFFSALFPQFLNAETPLLPQMLALGATYLIVDGISLICWGWAAQRVATRFSSTANKYIGKISGVMMIVAALLLGAKDIGPTD